MGDATGIMHVVNNVFLPRKLPQSAVPSEGEFVREFAQVLRDEVSDFPEAERMMRAWSRVQGASVRWELVHNSINALQPGESFCLYLRAQNAGITIQDHEGTATLAVFRVAATAQEVMEAPGELTDVFPSWAVTTDATRVRSESFAVQVADLANTEFVQMRPKSRKAGTDVPETRDVVDPSYVTTWLMAAVAGESTITGEGGVARVRKKTRDDVLWSDAELPWRRSGEYMTVKAMLHSSLVSTLGEHQGLISYKYVMIQAMSRIMVENHKVLQTDLVSQMLSKLARRLSKLSNLLKQGPAIRQKMHSRVEKVLQQCSTTVVDIRASLDTRWKGIMERERREFEMVLDTSKLEFGKDVTHSLVNARQHLQLALDSTLEVLPVEVRDPMCAHRNTGSSFPNLEYLGSTGEALYDIEVWVQTILWPGREASSELIFQLLTCYLGVAKGYYSSDALGSSKMVMTAFTLVATLDYLATRKHPLLLSYDHGVNVSVLQSLLLVHRADMEHLAALEAYFAARSRDASSLISEDQPSPKSLAVRFVDRNSHLQKMKNEILTAVAIKESLKLQEVARERAIHRKLLEAVRNQPHQYIKDRYGYELQYCCTSWCSKCSTETQARNMRVAIYERWLPEEGYLQSAVVYELATPAELSVLRDALHLLNRDVLGVKMGEMENRGTWMNYEPLKAWVERSYKKMTTLCSSSKLFSASHYSNSLHPSAPDSDFIKPNGFNVHLMEADSRVMASTREEASGELSFLTLPMDGDYTCLHWTVATTSHDENQVLARQVQCPPKLDLAEFKAFGCLRAGHRLQMRNIARALEMQTLSLFQPSVVNLLSQAFWQTGPPANSDWVRESHVDLQEKFFAEYMIQQLRSWLERNQENWKDHLGLLSIVIIAARILALSQSAAACDVLLSCRSVAESWLEKIEQVLGEMSASSVKKIHVIRSKLVDVAAIAALTFDLVGVQSDGDVTSWLRAVARICDNTRLNADDSSSASFAVIFQRNLLRRVKVTALGLEGALDEWITDSKSCLSEFVSQHWADGDQGRIERWTRYASPCGRWWKATFEHKSGRKMTLQVDILGGSFLVDGCPVARLPPTITSHPHYSRVFGKHVFQVQPAAGSPGSFVTCYKLNGSNFTFALVDGNRLLVMERRSGGCELELFPSVFFQGDLPTLLIERHSHWILKPTGKPFKHMDPGETLGCVLFRPVKFEDVGFTNIEGVPFVLNITSRRVRDTNTDRNLVDVRSSSFQELHKKLLHRLELREFVHVFDNGTVVAELPRMGLRFTVDPEADVIWSSEHPGFSVSRNQNIGTLIGLRNGVLLEEHNVSEPCTRKHYFIIPHTSRLLKRIMKVITPLDQHPSVKMDLTEFSSPSFFVYEVDHRLQSLRGPASGPTAWLYLALLHAATSHLLPDPFTGLTGAESAMRLLQSPRCWSCMPYQREAVSILHSIANLSPQREWYPAHLHCMQQVKWPEALFSSTALDAFRVVVEKLISDSERLRFLYPSSQEPAVLPPANSTRSLRLKYYWRSRETFGKEARMDSANEGEPPGLQSTYMNLSREVFQQYTFVRSLAEAGHEWRRLIIAEGKSFLSGLLLSRGELIGVGGADHTSLSGSTVSTWRLLKERTLHDMFVDLYVLATQAGEHRETFTLFLSVLGYVFVENTSIRSYLSILHCVAIHATEFKFVVPPRHLIYEKTAETVFDMVMVTGKVKENLVSFDVWMPEHGGSPHYNESADDFYSRTRKTFDRIQARSIEKMTKNAEKCWQCDASASFIQDATIKHHSATQSINKLFTRWRHNRELHTFVKNVEKKVADLCYEAGATLAPTPFEAPINLPTSATLQPFHFETHVSLLRADTRAEARSIFETGWFSDTEITQNRECVVKASPEAVTPFPLQPSATASSCEIAKKFHADLETSWLAHHKSPPLPSHVVVQEELEGELQAFKRKSRSLWDEICDAVQPRCDVSRALEAAGLWRRARPSVLLACVRDDKNDLANVRVELGALVVIWTLEQQAERCLRLLHNKDVALQKELANRGHANWQPAARPEWLMLELEGDYFMRAIQVDVAKTMLRSSENLVLQLNMGEGKTSVIVPALCAHIPDGKRFARLTVLGSLFRMNFDALVSKLGGLLNQRVYTFPFRRDISIDARGVHAMREVYEECISRRGVVVMRPEHRLSTILKSLELCRLGVNLAAEMRSLHDMVERNARDILDESDLLLHVKYQVVYTVGEQMDLDGGHLRWKVSQSVLRRAQHHCSALQGMEFKAAAEGPFAFPHIRILDASLCGALCERVADDILGGGDDTLPLRQPRRQDAAMIRSFILPSDENVSVESIRMVYNEGPVLETLLILRGLLCYGALVHALQMRWRVQYGVRGSGKPKMAVPFRAKDVPVERAEFGHPDLAIMLTQLSYYHGGLSDAQLLDAFDRLHRSSTSAAEYQRWLSEVPLDALPPTLHTLAGVNLDDFVQRTAVLFPVLRRNMQVINFWLSTAVFPVESKMFEGKLAASAWDLSDHGVHPVTGFSGTKDTSLLLPSSITQRDLPKLQGTDGAVISKLLQEENTGYSRFPSCITSVEILETSVVTQGARVLLDVGALMVDMSNREVAMEWLRQLPDRTGRTQAAIYFDDDDQIMSIDRDGRAAPLALSPYHRQMDRCVVYLDDVHTRGTDLKIPHGSHACVTLGRGITKDRLVQACMRMRMLGEGHSVSFWASQEVHTSITQQAGASDKLTSIDVLRWVIRNTVDATQDGFRHWGAQGIAYARKKVVNQLFESRHGERSLRELGLLSTDPEVTKLVVSYGGERKKTILPRIMKSRLLSAATEMNTKLALDAGTMILKQGRSVTDRISEYASQVKCFSQVLDEEQERELEHELEEEEEVQRPGAATPRKPHLAPHVRELATSGSFSPDRFLPLMEVFKGCATLWKLADSRGWNDKIFVTLEFATVLAPGSDSSGVQFLRPVEWCAVTAEAMIVLVSPFEANELLPEFRRGRGAALRMFAPRIHRGQSLMLCDRSLSLPPGDAIPDSLVAQLIAFSGGAFFANESEQDAYCEFLGLCPRPRSEREDEAFQRGDIQDDGFFPPEKRPPGGHHVCAFPESPVVFVTKLLSARGWMGQVSASHVGQILFIGQRTHELGNNS